MLILSQEVHPGGTAFTAPIKTGSYSLSCILVGGMGSQNNQRGKARFMNEFLRLSSGFFYRKTVPERLCKFQGRPHPPPWPSWSQWLGWSSRQSFWSWNDRLLRCRSFALSDSPLRPWNPRGNFGHRLFRILPRWSCSGGPPSPSFAGKDWAIFHRRWSLSSQYYWDWIGRLPST